MLSRSRLTDCPVTLTVEVIDSELEIIVFRLYQENFAITRHVRHAD